jgi:hypothetical protein
VEEGSRRTRNQLMALSSAVASSGTWRKRWVSDAEMSVLSVRLDPSETFSTQRSVVITAPASGSSTIKERSR